MSLAHSPPSPSLPHPAGTYSARQQTPHRFVIYCITRPTHLAHQSHKVTPSQVTSHKPSRACAQRAFPFSPLPFWSREKHKVKAGRKAHEKNTSTIVKIKAVKSKTSISHHISHSRKKNRSREEQINSYYFLMSSSSTSPCKHSLSSLKYYS